MSIPKISFYFGDSGVVTTPIKVKVPSNATPGQAGHTTPRHTEKVCFVNFEVLSEPEIQELLEVSEIRSKRLLEAKAKYEGAVGEKDRATSEKELRKAEKDFKSWRSIFLRRVVVGFPNNHGWDAIFKDIPEFSADLVEAMAGFRPVGIALDTAYWAMLDGSSK